MIARIHGLVVEKLGDSVVVDVGGVGYLLRVPATLLGELELEQEVTLHVHTEVRQDAIQLFGFASRGEREAYELLRGVTGVGPKGAIAVLGTMGVQELADAVALQDLRSIQRAPGVGKKVAQRIVIDLAGKITPEFVPVGLPGVKPAPRPKDPLPLALAQLGYKRSEIDRALAWIGAEGKADAPLDERIRLSLKHLSGR